MDSRQKAMNLIGLATKAGKTASGEFSTEKAVKTGKAQLVIVSEEASDNTKKMFTNMCTFYKKPIYFYSDKESLGMAIGQEMRSSVAVTNPGIAGSIIKILEGS